MHAQKEQLKQSHRRAVAHSTNRNRDNIPRGFGFLNDDPNTLVQRRLQGYPTTSANRGEPIQMLTALVYDPSYQRPGATSIAEMLHARVPMTTWERIDAATNSGYRFARHAPGACNHHVPYAMVRDGVKALLTSAPNLTTSVQNVRRVNVGGGVRGVNIPNTGTRAAPTFDEDVLNSEIDDMVANLANDPRNLFFWPRHTGDGNGTRIDEPTGRGPMRVNTLRRNLRNYQNLLRRQNVIR